MPVISPLHNAGFQNRLSFVYDGIDERVEVTNHASFNFAHTDAYTLQKYFELNGIGITQVLCGKRFGNATYGYVLYVTTANILEMLIQGTAGGRIRVVSTTVLAASTYYQVHCTVDGSANANGVKIYLDGVDDTGAIVQNNLTTTSANTANLMFARQPAVTIPFYMAGYHDEVAVWNVALTPGQVLETRQGTKPKSLKSHSQFANCILWHRNGDGDTFNVTTDHSPLAFNHGTQVNMETADTQTHVPV